MKFNQLLDGLRKKIPLEILFIIFLFSLILWSSYNDTQEYIDERTEILKNTPFDQRVISSIDKFESIRKLLILNKEAFIGTEENGIISFKRIGQKETLRLHRQKVDSLPNYLKKVELLVKELVREGIFRGVHLNRDSSIMFVIQSTYISEYPSDLNKNLFKGKKYKLRTSRGTNVGKDTLLNDDWIYRIYVDRRYGH